MAKWLLASIVGRKQHSNNARVHLQQVKKCPSHLLDSHYFPKKEGTPSCCCTNASSHEFGQLSRSQPPVPPVPPHSKRASMFLYDLIYLLMRREQHAWAENNGNMLEIRGQEGTPPWPLSSLDTLDSNVRETTPIRLRDQTSNNEDTASASASASS